MPLPNSVSHLLHEFTQVSTHPPIPAPSTTHNPKEQLHFCFWCSNPLILVCHLGWELWGTRPALSSELELLHCLDSIDVSKCLLAVMKQQWWLSMARRLGLSMAPSSLASGYGSLLFTTVASSGTFTWCFSFLIIAFLERA